MPGRTALTLLGAIALSACASASIDAASTSPRSAPASAPPPASTTVPSAVPTAGSTTASSPHSTPRSTASVVSATPSPTTTISPVLQRVEIGTSRAGRPIEAVERGTPGGVVVLVVGVIHGDEPAGARIVDVLAKADVPPGVDLWLVETINPDGLAQDERGNAAGVDLNRNFPHDWRPLGQPGDGQYAGTGAASEPETQAAVDFIERIDPALTIWYHQDLFRISPASGREGEVRARYAQLTGLPLLSITGGTYTGVAATWQRRTLRDAVAFVVELGPSITAAEAAVHADAVLTVAADRTLFPLQPGAAPTTRG